MTNKKSSLNINIGELTWFIILIAISLYFFTLVYTGNIKIFIHPAMIKYTIFASVFLLILSIFQLPKIFKNKYDKPRPGYIIFAIPIIIGILANPLELNQNASNSKNITLVQNSDMLKDTSSINKSGPIVFNDNNYLNMMNEINDTPNKFKNRQIVLKGFIYRDSSLDKNQFVIARELMTCCAADTQIIGFLCSYNGPAIDADTWIQVTGTLSTTNYIDANSKQKSLLPLLEIKNISKIPLPKSKYIYFNYKQ
ncbi:TIGR03943 family putative permease subunit [Clostridium luticellarii]|jgi:putative membrane protein|uniref:Two-component membrane permease complex subunit n=1 Tax=Clostridium luticellarii TaxID=1691940 RepID=A0A2T0BMD6_9CLOT|nr:TIGR03943 family protein [Clostridium luticellarii]MCI1945002.1 TIGR03943 family protein [Clostridium luticellarii]MCI1967848.1 TIGR03943 family protein [Clostridium luticellarii]MCI1995782.1 TIGR03943 family protein [Clostridium luticellarii]MCI2040921.1 TIGR03943 family protein [Clostridium luticellarii]PRR85038.1 hypothetical protein CLLU_19520 [Clostridium luticellarii]